MHKCVGKKNKMGWVKNYRLRRNSRTFLQDPGELPEAQCEVDFNQKSLKFFCAQYVDTQIFDIFRRMLWCKNNFFQVDDPLTERSSSCVRSVNLVKSEPSFQKALIKNHKLLIKKMGSLCKTWKCKDVLSTYPKLISFGLRCYLRHIDTEKSKNFVAISPS